MRACPGICGPHDDHIVNIVFMPKHREIASRVIWGKTRSTNTCLPSPSPSLRFLAYLGRLQRRVTVLVRPKHIYFSFFLSTTLPLWRIFHTNAPSWSVRSPRPVPVSGLASPSPSS